LADERPCPRSANAARKRKRPLSEDKGLFQFILSTSRSIVLNRTGNDLLSQALRLSTIGAEAFNGRVRDGIGFWALRNCHQFGEEQLSEFWFLFLRRVLPMQEHDVWCLSRSFLFKPPTCWHETRQVLRTLINENDQANRAISTGQLHTLLRFHIRPINVVVFHGSQGNTSFEGGFPLRCFQRLSRPNLATLQCGWRHNRSTRGSSNPVLSY
jgi:hypothetical protein